MSDAIVACRGLVKRYGERTAVAGVDLDVPPGICFGLLGPNGAGKTTTLRMIYGVTHATEGSVRVFGLDVAHEARRVRARLGVTLQENALIEQLSALDNLRVFGRYHRLRASEIEQRADELIDFLELRSHKDVAVARLSGGFQRRLAVALSLMNRPELLILDEPTTGLDPAVRRALWERIRALRAEGTTVLLTTHYMDEAERLCDRLVILAEGRIVADGSPAALIHARLAAQALEVAVPEAMEPLVLGELAGVRHLRTERRFVFYANDAAALLERLRRRDAIADPTSVVVRPSNLEDVFLAATGTRLEGDA